MNSYAKQQKYSGYSRTVTYTNRDHFGVIFQRWGSVNQKVFPFCFVNVILTLSLMGLLNMGIDLTISEFGHEFMSVLVAFLVINKLSFTLGLYYELQGYLSKVNQASIEVTQLACVYTKHLPALKPWRLKVIRETLILLKTIVSVIHKGGHGNVWETPELARDVPRLALHDKPIAGSKVFVISGVDGNTALCRSEKNLRLPIRMAHRLRSAVMEHVSVNDHRHSLSNFQETQLLATVKEIMDSYHGIRKYLTCPLPLPLVQLGRIFVTFYVFTLPFALLSPELNLQYSQMVLLIFLMTYGFMGIELLFVEIDDPWADDANDLPLLEMAHAAAEDILLSLRDVDGQKATDELEAFFGVERLSETYPTETDPLVV